MSTLLLQTLSQDDVAWLRQVGQCQTVEANTALWSPTHISDHLYLVLQGQLAVMMRSSAGVKELMSLSAGSLVGQLPAIATYWSEAAVGAAVDALVLAVPTAAIADKLQSAPDFAARFYRLVALQLRQQLTQWAAQIGYSIELLGQLQLKEAATVFGELSDRDLDWLVAVGEFTTIQPGTAVLTCGEPVDALHILVAGAVALQASAAPTPLMTQAFAPDGDRTEQEFTRLSRGDLMGETIFLEPTPAAFSAIALREAQILHIPRWRLTAKLLYDPDFAARLYRLLAILLANKQRVMLHKLGLLGPDTELDNPLIERVMLAEARFDWFVKRLQSHHNVGAPSW